MPADVMVALVLVTLTVNVAGAVMAIDSVKVKVQLAVFGVAPAVQILVPGEVMAAEAGRITRPAAPSTTASASMTPNQVNLDAFNASSCTYRCALHVDTCR